MLILVFSVCEWALGLSILVSIISHAPLVLNIFVWQQQQHKICYLERHLVSVESEAPFLSLLEVLGARLALLV